MHRQGNISHCPINVTMIWNILLIVWNEVWGTVHDGGGGLVRHRVRDGQIGKRSEKHSEMKEKIPRPVLLISCISRIAVINLKYCCDTCIYWPLPYQSIWTRPLSRSTKTIFRLLPTYQPTSKLWQLVYGCICPCSPMCIIRPSLKGCRFSVSQNIDLSGFWP